MVGYGVLLVLGGVDWYVERLGVVDGYVEMDCSWIRVEREYKSA